MPTRTLVATLGATPLRPARYFLHGAPATRFDTEYAALATAVLVGGVSQAFVLLTHMAREAHWDSFQRQCEANGVVAAAVDIPDGANPAEIWRIFDCLNRTVPEDSELVIDITNALRHLPVVLLASLAYLTAERRVRVAGVFYGAYQTVPLGDPVPILDLSAYMTLADSFHALRQFRETGDARALAAYLNDLAAGLWRRDAGVSSLWAFARSVERVGWSLVTPLPIEAGLAARAGVETLQQSRALLDDPLASSVIGAVEPLLAGIAVAGHARGKAFALTPDELRRQLALVRFYVDMRAYDRALLLLREWIVNCCLLAGHVEDQWLVHAERSRIERRLYALHARAQTDAGRASLPAPAHQLAALWDGVADQRNRFAHAGMRPEPVRADLTGTSLQHLLDQTDAVSDTAWCLPSIKTGRTTLISALGLSPGLLFSALVRERPDGVAIVTSTAAEPLIDEICTQAKFPREALDVALVDDPHRCFTEAPRVVDRLRETLLSSDALAVNLTGGTTALQYVVERVAREASRLGVPLRRIALVDARPSEEQRREPYVVGDVVEVERDNWPDAPAEAGR
jgi:hypothetical protein